uniref:Cyclin N-terminal domain-containing protein n=1 Tax=Chaetoceros debilis TaxID=122233 RepID=A0A6S8W101_9STRA|mmetsp:Transcript_27781/g.42560  ORF Transcript_27781/g.42560 Transcript_27781/m.42560 type:complete len:666 (+) Transcript_27781:259-2256(+)
MSEVLQPPVIIMAKHSSVSSEYKDRLKAEVSQSGNGNIPILSSDSLISDGDNDRSCMTYFENENSGESANLAITPRTSSLATFLSIDADDQCQFDDSDSHCEASKLLTLLSSHEETISFSKNMNAGSSPTNSNFLGNGNFEERKASSPYSKIIHDNFGNEPNLSIDICHTSLAPPLQPPQIYNYSGPTRALRNVKPIVYSAIGSLENVNQSNLGSFNTKLLMATTSKKGKKERQVKVNATTSQINLRKIHGPKKASIIQETNVASVRNSKSSAKLSTSNTASAKISPNGLGGSQKISTLSSTLSFANALQVAQMDGKHLMTSAGVEEECENTKLHDTKGEKSNLSMIITEECKTSFKQKKKAQKKKGVTIDDPKEEIRHVGLFRPSCDAYTPRMGRKTIKYKPQEQRASMEQMATTMGTIQKPNFKDALRRVAMIIQQHIVKIERMFDDGADHSNLFSPKMRDAFAEENFVTPRYKCTITKIPMARSGIVYGMRKIRLENKIPTADDIYQFAHRLFKQVQLSSECSIICLIYVERLMETAKVPLMAKTWKPIFMCGLLLASKVWQDWSSWNIEFASVYPSFSVEAINKLELQFLKFVKWDLYISSSLYAKYYFALRSLLEKQDFKKKYVRMVGGVGSVAASEAMKVSKRSELLKEKSLAYLSLSV